MIPFDEACRQARARYGHLTPYRIGLVLGEAGERTTLPGDKQPRWYEFVRQGKRDAAQWKAEREAAEPAIGEQHEPR